MQTDIITAINKLLPSKESIEAFHFSKAKEHYGGDLNDSREAVYRKWVSNLLSDRPTLEPAPAIPAGFPANLMAVKYGQPRYALDGEGRLTGLNLAGLGLEDGQWKAIAGALERAGVRLRGLNLRENRLKDFVPPPGVEALKMLDIEENPLENPPPEVVKQGNEAILRHFERLQRETEKDYLFEAKVLLVGKTGAGKTSLRYKLRHPDTPMPKDDESTKGIDVEAIEFPLGNGKQFRMNIWDFEGQQISHQTHQFFLTKRSFYVFIADQRTEKPDFDYWLQIVELLGEKSPMLIFHNEKKGRVCDLNLEGIRQSFGHFLMEEEHRANLDLVGKGGSFDAGQFKNFSDFRSALMNILQKLPIVGIQIEKSWVKVRAEIEKLAREKPHISAFELWSICQAQGVEEEQDQKDLSRLFHDLGIFLHFQEDDKPSLLNRIVILQNDWATKAVYMVLKSEWLQKEKLGHFTLADLRKVWQGTDYASHCEELLELMMRFELCYQIEKSNVYIAPQILPASPPKDYEFPDGEVLLLRFGYDFMPKGIITRLTVRMHPFIARRQTLAWKDGFVLEHHDAVAEVVETYGKREIHVKATGKHRRKLLNEIAYEVNRLNGEYHFSERIKSYMLLPCCCAICKDAEEPYFFKYHEVTKYREEGWGQVPCGTTGKPAKVADLLANILEGKEEAVFEIRRYEAELSAIRSGQENIERMLANLKSGRISEQAQSDAVAALEPLLQALLEKLPAKEAQKVQQINQAPDLKSKLKLAIPIIPTVLSYETELQWDWNKVKSSLRGLVM